MVGRRTETTCSARPLTRWSKGQLDDYLQKRGGTKLPEPTKAEDSEPVKYKSKTEARYAQLLELRKRAGEIARYEYEPITLVVGKKLRYTPDFYIEHHDGSFELHEIKGGYIRRGGLNKFKNGVDKFPNWNWQLWQWKGGQWQQIRRDLTG